MDIKKKIQTLKEGILTRRRGLLVAIPFILLVCLAAYLGWKWWGLLGENRPTLYVTLFGNLFEDLVFFSFLGIALLIYQRHRPELEVLSKRIQYLYGGRNLRERALEHNINALKRLAGYRRLSKVTITIHEHNQDVDAYRVMIERTYEIENLLRDADHEDTVEIKINLDPFDEAELEKIGGKVGEITKAQLTPKGGSAERKLPETATFVGDSFNTKFDISVPADSEAKLEIVYWMWVKVSTRYTVSIIRFSEQLLVEFGNFLTEPITIWVDEAGGRTIDIVPSHTVSVTEETDVPVGRKFVYGWRPPKVEPAEN